MYSACCTQRQSEDLSNIPAQESCSNLFNDYVDAEETIPDKSDFEDKCAGPSDIHHCEMLRYKPYRSRSNVSESGVTVQHMTSQPHSTCLPLAPTKQPTLLIKVILF